MFEEFINQHFSVASHTIFVFVGYFVAMCINYVKFGQELSFIKGQLSKMLETQDTLADVVDKSTMIERDLFRTMVSLDQIHERLKLLEDHIFNNAKGES